MVVAVRRLLELIAQRLSEPIEEGPDPTPWECFPHRS
jgi:hypothetical protein